MKHIVLTLTALLAAASVYGQGTVNFATRVSGQLDAPVTIQGTTTTVDGNWWGQLYAGAPGGALAPVGAPVEFRTGTGQGYITAGGNVAITGVAGGSPAQVQLVAWNKALGNDYAAAKAANQGGWGESTVITVAATGNPTSVPPTTAANLTGLQGFTVLPLVPEPSIAALGLLGAGLLLIRRKK